MTSAQDFSCDCCGSRQAQIFCGCMFAIYALFLGVLIIGCIFYIVQKQRGITGVKSVKTHQQNDIGMDGSLFCPGKFKRFDELQYFEVIMLWIVCELLARMLFLSSGFTALHQNSIYAITYGR